MATRKKDPLDRLACYARHQLERGGKQPDELFNRISDLALTCRSIATCWQSGVRARERGWLRAAERRYQAVREQLPMLHTQANSALLWQDSSPPPLPTIPLLLAELKQLHQEFELVEIDLKAKRIKVTTSRVALEEVDLGPFVIELRLDLLFYHRSSQSFRCIALDAHPPGTRDGITHPHVSDEILCTGDASTPVSHALSEGRLCDAFMLMNAVLHTYNSGNAYVALSDWEGEPCATCDRTMNADDSYFCDGCLRSVCEECIGHCDGCDESRCGGCLEQDFYERESLCASCQRTCTQCCHIVARSRFDLDSGLCSVCLEERKKLEAVKEKLAPPLFPDSSISAPANPPRPRRSRQGSPMKIKCAITCDDANGRPDLVG